MKIFWTTIEEASKINPQIFVHNLKADGFFIGTPGTMIFRSKEEALKAIDAAKLAALKKYKEEQK